MQGMTLKQAARKEFFEALDSYKEARKTLTTDSMRFVGASLRIHRALAAVPKSYKTMVNKAFRGEI